MSYSRSRSKGYGSDNSGADHNSNQSENLHSDFKLPLSNIMSLRNQLKGKQKKFKKKNEITRENLCNTAINKIDSTQSLVHKLDREYRNAIREGDNKEKLKVKRRVMHALDSAASDTHLELIFTYNELEKISLKNLRQLKEDVKWEEDQLRSDEMYAKGEQIHKERENQKKIDNMIQLFTEEQQLRARRRHQQNAAVHQILDDIDDTPTDRKKGSRSTKSRPRSNGESENHQGRLDNQKQGRPGNLPDDAQQPYQTWKGMPHGYPQQPIIIYMDPQSKMHHMGAPAEMHDKNIPDEHNPESIPEKHSEPQKESHIGVLTKDRQSKSNFMTQTEPAEIEEQKAKSADVQTDLPQNEHPVEKEIQSDQQQKSDIADDAKKNDDKKQHLKESDNKEPSEEPKHDPQSESKKKKEKENEDTSHQENSSSEDDISDDDFDGDDDKKQRVRKMSADSRALRCQSQTL